MISRSPNQRLQLCKAITSLIPIGTTLGSNLHARCTPVHAPETRSLQKCGTTAHPPIPVRFLEMLALFVGITGPRIDMLSPVIVLPLTSGKSGAPASLREYSRLSSAK
jgi:hypothetical protein